MCVEGCQKNTAGPHKINSPNKISSYPVDLTCMYIFLQ